MSLYRYLYIQCASEMAGFANLLLNPVNGQAVEFEVKREPGNIFFRTTLKTTLIFTGADYAFLKTIDAGGYRCSKNCLTIQKLCAGTWVDFWSGKFSFTYFKVNDDDCRIEFTPDVNDAYTCLLQDGALEQNILKIPSIKTVFAPNSVIFEYAVCQKTISVCAVGTNPCTNFIYCDAIQSNDILTYNYVNDCLSDPDWQMYSTKISNFITPGNVGDVTTAWFREVKITLDVGGVASAPAGSSWINRGPATLAGQPAHRWTRIPFGGAYTAQSFYQPLWQHTSNPCTQIFEWTNPTPVTYSYNRGRHLKDVIQYLLESSGCFPSGVNVVSDFFRINSALTPADPDYVFGGKTEIDQLILFQKSDIKNSTSSEAASTGLLSFIGLMDMLAKTFCRGPYGGGVYWKIMPGGEIRIEHIKWFVENQGLDTTQPAYNAYTRRTNKYSFMRQELPSIEHFEMMEQNNIDFVGKDITYDSLCVNRDKDGRYESRIPNLTTDIAFIQTDPTAIADNGFVLMATTLNPDGTYNLIVSPGELTGLDVLNAPLAWANLHENYGKWGRVQPNGNMNGQPTSFLSWIRTRRQEPFSIPVCCDDDINYNDLIKTELGWGEVETATFTTQTDKLKLNLLHY